MNESVKVMDTEDNLLKKFNEGKDKILNILQWVIQKQKAQKGWDFWVTLHQKVS